MDTGGIATERRSEQRKAVRISFLIRIGQLFKARGVIKDINRQGMCLKCPQLFRPRLSTGAREYIGGPLRITLPSNGLTVDGMIAWVNLKKGEGAIRITGTSDEARWLEIYEKGQ
ncbi:MAG TPA: hypothetical protein PKM41_01915 [Deltaproteobacteria bacterium]|nr:hypothetical protein [Deltaproteobacteria bacterium]HOI05711.1 hypothetical protein [Deltaproteobacteria bacterium]